MTEFLEYTFFRYALAGVVLISVSAAIIGSYIISRRMVSIAGGVTHACFGGSVWAISWVSVPQPWPQCLLWRRALPWSGWRRA